MVQTIDFDSLPTEIIVLIISFSELKEFHSWSLVSHKLSRICKGEILMGLVKENSTVTKAWIHTGGYYITTITTRGKAMAFKKYRTKIEPKNDYLLDNVYSVKGEKYHGTSASYYYRRRKKKIPGPCDKYRAPTGKIVSLFKNNCVGYMESYDMDVRHGWWKHHYKYEICYDHDVPIAYRDPYVRIDIVNDKINLIFEREYHHRTEYIIVHQNKIIYMHVKLGKTFEYIDGGSREGEGKEKEERESGSREGESGSTEDKGKEDDISYETVLKQFKLWLANHNAIPITLDLTKEPHISIDMNYLAVGTRDRHFKDFNQTKDYVIPKPEQGWKKLIKCN